MSQRASIYLIAVFLSPLATAQKSQLAVDCSSKRLSIAEKETCAEGDIRTASAEVDALTAQLERTLTGRSLEALVDTEVPLLRQRNNCSNVPAGAHSCVTQVVNRRLKALKEAMSSPSTIVHELSQAAFVDVAYFSKWGSELVGRSVSIYGCMTLDPGPSPELRTRGSIGDSSAAKTSQRVSVIFNSMNGVKANNFYDAKGPCSHWHGVVRLDGAQLALVEVEP